MITQKDLLASSMKENSTQSTATQTKEATSARNANVILTGKWSTLRNKMVVS
jgi:hypothetical protein